MKEKVTGSFETSAILTISTQCCTKWLNNKHVAPRKSQMSRHQWCLQFIKNIFQRHSINIFPTFYIMITDKREGIPTKQEWQQSKRDREKICIYTRESRKNKMTQERKRKACNATMLEKVRFRIPDGANNALLVYDVINQSNYNFLPKKDRLTCIIRVFEKVSQ